MIKTENQLIQIAQIPLDMGSDDADLAALTLLVKYNLWNTEALTSILTTKAAVHNEYKSLLEKLKI
ncbi:MAG: hypothetical protein GPJ54_03490 [Candidatus Heimdallarchaeota archaeon]|nr:hypothetical protein [Candidatus Heimdallarchaeota archaeon]